MDWILIVVAALLVILGIVGTLLPVLPGLPLSYVGLLLLHFTHKVDFTPTFLMIWALVVVVIQVLDFYLPLWGTKKFGGSTMGLRGSTIGLIVGLFMGPMGILLGPFVGALVGELINKSNFSKALKAATGAFIGFIVGTFSKIVAGLFMVYYFVAALIA